MHVVSSYCDSISDDAMGAAQHFTVDRSIAPDNAIGDEPMIA
jgi:hypothetical protein